MCVYGIDRDHMARVRKSSITPSVVSSCLSSATAPGCPRHAQTRRQNRWVECQPVVDGPALLKHALIPGSLLFCPDCGTLLNLPQDGEDEVTCEQCGHQEPASCAYSLFTPSVDGLANASHSVRKY